MAFKEAFIKAPTPTAATSGHPPPLKFLSRPQPFFFKNWPFFQNPTKNQPLMLNVSAKMALMPVPQYQLS